VFPFVAEMGTKSIDVSPLIQDTSNVLLMAEGGGILFICSEPGVYEVHTAFLKPDRATQSQNGPHIRNVCLAAYRWMFTHTDCLTLITRMPAHNRALAVFSPLVGWVKEFERKAIWCTQGGELVDVAFATIRYSDWVRKTPELMESGKWFHHRLDEEAARLGHTEPRHADEECHDLHVGACVEMIYGGMVDKALMLYNGWAHWAGYGAISLVTRNPFLLDIGDALLHLTGDDFRVLKWKR
jgi:hypothetical protein